MYREILIYTGPEPDLYRDYQLTERIDNLLGRLEAERDNLESIRENIIIISGNTSEKTGILDTVILQLNDFLEKPREIHRNLATYNSNISSLGTLVLLLSAQPLEVDYFMIHGQDDVFPQSKATTLQSMWFSIRSFLATFVTDYSSLGETDEFQTNETIEEPEKQIVGIAHADAYEESLYMMEEIQKRVKVREFINTSYDYCTGSHVGPDTIALFYLGKDRSLL